MQRPAAAKRQRNNATIRAQGDAISNISMGDWGESLQKHRPSAVDDRPRKRGIDPSQFYSKRKGKSRSSDTAAERQLKQILEDATRNERAEKRRKVADDIKQKRRLYHNATALRLFPLQDMALDFLDELLQKPMQNFSPSALYSMVPRIFAIETSTSGKRKYIVGHAGRIMISYLIDCDPGARHYYELIRPETPCRLYFDLEFDRDVNDISLVEAEKLMGEFIEELGAEILQAYGIRIGRSNVVDLDSSTATKFSRHLIVHLPNGQLFASSYHAGQFAKRLVGRIADETATGVLRSKGKNHLAKHLFVGSKRKGGSNEVCFVDLGVYTKNRLFRILGSHKFGKTSAAALRISETSQFKFPQRFENSKLSSRKKSVQSLDDPQTSDLDSLRVSLDFSSHAEALAQTLVVPLHSQNCELLECGISADSAATAPVTRRSSCLASRVKSNHGSSPIPLLDNYILCLSNRGGVRGKIRAWSIGPTTGKSSHHITYHMSDNRWCERIGRMHKSNNIIWNVRMDNSSGAVCYQTCHDPECRMMHFKGASKPLPDDVQTEMREYFLDREIAELDVNEIIQGNRGDTPLSFEDASLDAELSELDLSHIVSKIEESGRSNTIDSTSTA